MYIDLIVLVVLAIIVFILFKNFRSLVYFIAISDIFLRILTFIKLNIPLPDVAQVIDNYIPESLPAIIDKYTSGILYTVIIWIYVIIFIIFESYIIRTFWKNKR